MNIYENDDSPIAVGSRLKHLRILAGLNAIELAEKAGVSRGALSFWENAKSKTARPLSPTSVSKLIDAIRKAGVICSETWLTTGTGPPPVNYKNISQKASTIVNVDFEGISSLESYHGMEDEISLFTGKNKNAVIHQIIDNYMLPIFQSGDIVGGIWQPSATITKDKVCLIKVNNRLQIRRVKKCEEEGRFNVSYLVYEQNQAEPYEINNIILNEVAPITRLWRL